MDSFQKDLNWQEAGTWMWQRPTGHGCISDLDYDECGVARNVYEEIKATNEILFRGERINGLAKRYSPLGKSVARTRDHTKKLAKIAEALFFYGVKGKQFWDDSFFTPEAMEILKNLNIDDSEAIKYLLGFICNTDESQAALHVYFKRNKRLQTAFGRLNVRGNSVLGVLSRTDKRKLRDLLIFFLHNSSSSKFRTPLVSMSTEIKVAAGFASTEKNGRGGCVIAGFLPPRWHDRAVRLNAIDGCSEMLFRIELPLESFVNHKHAEVALFGAIFPNYVIWLMDINNKVIIWNPGIFEASEVARCKIPNHGIPIDQTDFMRRLGEETAFACGLERCDESDVEI
jgi:hypothetical protein